MSLNPLIVYGWCVYHNHNIEIDVDCSDEFGEIDKYVYEFINNKPHEFVYGKSCTLYTESGFICISKEEKEKVNKAYEDFITIYGEDACTSLGYHAGIVGTQK